MDKNTNNEYIRNLEKNAKLFEEKLQKLKERKKNNYFSEEDQQDEYILPRESEKLRQKKAQENTQKSKNFNANDRTRSQKAKDYYDEYENNNYPIQQNYVIENNKKLLKNDYRKSDNRINNDYISDNYKEEIPKEKPEKIEKNYEYCRNKYSNKETTDELWETIVSLENRIEYKENLITDLQAKLKNKTDDENLSLNKEYNNLSVNMEKLTEDIDNKNTLISKLEEENKNLKLKIDNLVLQNKNIKTKEEKNTETIENLELTLDKNKDEIKKLTNKVTSLEKINKKLQKDFDSLNNDFAKIKSDKDKNDIILEDQKSEISKYKKENKALNILLSEANSRLEKLDKKNIREYETKNSRTDIEEDNIRRGRDTENDYKQNKKNTQYENENINNNYDISNNYINDEQEIEERNNNNNQEEYTYINRDDDRDIQGRTNYQYKKREFGKKRNINNINQNSNIGLGNQNDYEYGGFNCFPSEKNKYQNKNEIDVLEAQLSQLLKEKNQLENEMFKLPDRPKTLIEIRRKKEINTKITKTDTDINSLRSQLRKLRDK